MYPLTPKWVSISWQHIFCLISQYPARFLCDRKTASAIQLTAFEKRQRICYKMFTGCKSVWTLKSLSSTCKPKAQEGMRGSVVFRSHGRIRFEENKKQSGGCGSIVLFWAHADRCTFPSINTPDQKWPLSHRCVCVTHFAFFFLLFYAKSHLLFSETLFIPSLGCLWRCCLSLLCQPSTIMKVFCWVAGCWSRSSSLPTAAWQRVTIANRKTNNHSRSHLRDSEICLLFMFLDCERRRQ